jgi:hypothetical protein
MHNWHAQAAQDPQTVHKLFAATNESRVCVKHVPS